MAVTDFLRKLGTPALSWVANREFRRFSQATRDCRATQHRVLGDLLALNAESRFSRRHGFTSGIGVHEFRKRIGICDYEYFRESIDCLKKGDHSAFLGPANRLVMFSLTSGTTASSKFIPVTSRFLADYRRGWRTWGLRAFEEHDDLITQSIVQLSSDHDQFRTEAGTPCGNISGLVAQMQSPLIRSLYRVPPIVAKIGDLESRRYAALRLAIADPNVGMVTTANPSTLIHLARFGDTNREELIRDIANGTLSDRFDIPNSVRQAIARNTRRPQPVRARELEQILSRTGHLFPRDYWPAMQVLAVWTGGSAGSYLPQLGDYYGAVLHRDHGLHASEGRMTIPVHAETSAGVLDLQTHFFEFIPEAEYGSENPITLEAHELERDCRYYVLLTTASGLCRYNICDVVECVGFEGTTPMLRFMHKGAHVSNITGEKVSESQVVTAVSQARDELRLNLEQFTVVPAWDDPPHYQLLLDRGDVLSQAAGHKLAGLVDARLKSLNCEYQEKRDSKRLGSISCVFLPEGAWKAFLQHRCVEVGGSVEQYKHPCLVPDPEFRLNLHRIAGYAVEEKLAS